MSEIIGFAPLASVWTIIQGGTFAAQATPPAAPPSLMSPVEFFSRLVRLINKSSQVTSQPPQNQKPQKPSEPPKPPEIKSPYRHAAAGEGQKTVFKESWTWSGDAFGRQRTFQEMLADTWDTERLREQLDQYEAEIRDLQRALQEEPNAGPRRARFVAALDAVQYNLVQVSLPLRAQIWVPRNIQDLVKKAEARQLLSRADYEAVLAEARLR